MRERMGSGGPRGLQILRSGASGVRGGFDSHAFPPLLRRARAALALAAALAAAGAPAAGAPAPATRDSLVAPAPGAAATRRALPPPGRFDAPGWVMLRSLVVPGWGQAHNGAWLKAAAVAGAEAALLLAVRADLDELDRLDAEVLAARAAGDVAREYSAVFAYNARLDRMVSRQWLLGGVVAYALLDAYVDAHFRNFRLEFESDPALPGGPPPGARLFLRWRF